MKLYFGGAFQGKREVMKRETGIPEEAVAEGGRDFDLSAVRAIDHYEEKVRSDLQAGADPLEELDKVLREKPDLVLIMNEVGQGVLPAEREDREFAEAAGRVLTAAAERADTVTRVFCGIGMRLKGESSE